MASDGFSNWSESFHPADVFLPMVVLGTIFILAVASWVLDEPRRESRVWVRSDWIALVQMMLALGVFLAIMLAASCELARQEVQEQVRYEQPTMQEIQTWPVVEERAPWWVFAEPMTEGDFT